jgi:hypothetical protein
MYKQDKLSTSLSIIQVLKPYKKSKIFGSRKCQLAVLLQIRELKFATTRFFLYRRGVVNKYSRKTVIVKKLGVYLRLKSYF